MEYEDRVCDFKKYVNQTLDLLVDSYKWKVMAEDCEDNLMANKYMSVSDTLFNIFMTEHNEIGEIFKGE